MIRKITFFMRFYNNSYNFVFKKFNNIKIDKPETVDTIKENLKYLKHTTAFHTGWLLNLKRLYDLTRKKFRYKRLSVFRCWMRKCYSSFIYAYKKISF